MNSSNQRGTEGLLELVERAEQWAKHIDMRELSPDAPRYTGNDRCPTRSMARPDHRCVLQAGHVNKGFLYCQFSAEDKGAEMRCDASEARRGDVFAEPCGKKAVAGTYRCPEHTEE